MASALRMPVPRRPLRRPAASPGWLGHARPGICHRGVIDMYSDRAHDVDIDIDITSIS
jgi:hypothetical protein